MVHVVQQDNATSEKHRSCNVIVIFPNLYGAGYTVRCPKIPIILIQAPKCQVPVIVGYCSFNAAQLFSLIIPIINLGKLLNK